MTVQTIKDRHGRLAIAAYALLLFAFAFGGASQLNALRLALVELAALPLLVIGGTELIRRPDLIRRHRFALALLGLAIAVPLIQLIPLPPSVWGRLPGREEMLLAQELVGMTATWVPISLTPDATWNAVLALLPPTAMFLAILVAGPQLARTLVWITLAAVVVNLIAGGLQIASGTTDFHPWPNTRAGTISGLFANRNHLATLLLCSLPLAGALFGAGQGARSRENSAWVLIGGAYFALCLVGLAMSQSRAGLILAFPVTGLSLLVAWRASRLKQPGLALIGLGSGVIAALTAVVVLALPRAIQRFGSALSETPRLDRWPYVVEAANSYQPVGSGLGSFDPVYRAVEPLAELDATFFNQAHNEYLQIWLEAGLLGLIGMVAFFVWFGRRSWSAWFSGPLDSDALRRAASVAIAVILAHSLVDYPLRTETLLVLFALFCAMLEGSGAPGSPTASPAPPAGG